jgi:hypothetical protein
MFQEPDEAIARDAAAKLDRAAATQRSAIRRQPTVRPSRYNPDAFRYRLRRSEEQRQRELSHYRDEEEMNAELQIRQMQAEIARLRSRRGTRRAQGTSLRDAEALVEQSRSAFPDDENSDRDVNRPARRYDLPRPNRESSLRFEVSAPRSSSLSPYRMRMLSPPSSSGSGRNVLDGPLDDDSPVLTQGFAPARYQRGDDARLDLETPPPETWESSLPPLYRHSGRPSEPPHHVDGLGDRRRSPSPDRNVEEENWSNLLATMEPRHSSTATSFASNLDSGSLARNSQSTMATSFGEIAPDDGCDNELAPGITEEDARQIREMHRSRQRVRRRDPREPDGPIMTGELGLRMHEARIRRARGEGREGSRQIHMIQQIMERFGSREDLPDDWWTIMGWDDDLGAEHSGDSVRRSARPAAEVRRTESRSESRRDVDAQENTRVLEQAEEMMRELRSQGSQEII